jgi:hypothetical protein
MQRARAIYAAINQLPAATRSSHFFDIDLETRLAQHTRVIEVWLAHTEPLVQQGLLLKAAQAIATGHHDIRTFFQPKPHTLPPD